MAGQRITVPVKIASGTSLSASVNVNDARIIGVQMPAGWDAASISFAAVVADGTTYGKVQDAGGTEVVLTTPAAGVYIAIANTVALKALGLVKVRSGVAATPVNQTADRNFALVCVRE